MKVSEIDRRYPHIMRSLRLMAVDNDLRFKEDLEFKDNLHLEAVDNQLSLLDGQQLETFTIGEHNDILRLTEDMGLQLAWEFLESVFDGELHWKVWM